MPFEFMIQLHRRVDNGDDQLPTAEGAGTSTSPLSNRPRGLEMFLTEDRIDFGGIMQALFSNLDQSLSSNRPTAKAVIDNLPKVEKFVGDASSACAICLEPFSKSEGQPLTHLDCKHFFHLECIKPWLQEHNTCPTCRKEMKTEEVAEDMNPFGPLVPLLGAPTSSASARARTAEESAAQPRTSRPLILQRRAQSSRRQNWEVPSSTMPTLRTRTSTRVLRASGSRANSTPASSSAATTTTSTSRTQARSGVKRNARLQSQVDSSSVTEDSVAVNTETPPERVVGQTESTTHHRRNRRRLNSQVPSSPQVRRTTAPRGGLTLLSYVASASNGAGGTRDNLNFGLPWDLNSASSTAEPSAFSAGEEGRSVSNSPPFFPFATNGLHVQHVTDLTDELVDADMDGPISALLASVSASTRTADTLSSSMSSSAQTQSRTANRTLHYSHISSRRSLPERSTGNNEESTNQNDETEISRDTRSFVPNFVQRLAGLHSSTDEGNVDARPSPYRRRGVMRMRRFRVGRVRSASTAAATTSNGGSISTEDEGR